MVGATTGRVRMTGAGCCWTSARWPGSCATRTGTPNAFPWWTSTATGGRRRPRRLDHPGAAPRRPAPVGDLGRGDDRLADPGLLAGGAVPGVRHSRVGADQPRALPGVLHRRRRRRGPGRVYGDVGRGDD